MPALLKVCTTSGILAMAAISLLMRSMAAAGVPVAANTAMIGAKSKPGMVSAIAGTLGSWAERLAALLPSKRTWPLLTKPSNEGKAENNMSTWPPTKAGTDWPVPLNGMWVISNPNDAFIDSMVR